jgi:hypothetical protein
MLVGTHQRLAKISSFQIMARDTTLERVYKYKYLGVVLDPCLSWNDHIDFLTNKISSRLGMLRKARRILPRETCITLYNAMILPLITAPQYGIAMAKQTVTS